MVEGREPYPGVRALFNGDLHLIDPAYAPREDWIVMSPRRIEHVQDVAMRPVDVEPGDIIDLHGDPVTIHAVWRYDSGDVALRFRHAGNPGGVDWRGFLEHDRSVRLLSRGVARVDGLVRSLLPANSD